MHILIAFNEGERILTSVLYSQKRLPSVHLAPNHLVFYRDILALRSAPPFWISKSTWGRVSFIVMNTVALTFTFAGKSFGNLLTDSLVLLISVTIANLSPVLLISCSRGQRCYQTGTQLLPLHDVLFILNSNLKREPPALLTEAKVLMIFVY